MMEIELQEDHAGGREGEREGKEEGGEETLGPVRLP